MGARDGRAMGCSSGRVGCNEAKSSTRDEVWRWGRNEFGDGLETGWSEEGRTGEARAVRGKLRERGGDSTCRVLQSARPRRDTFEW